MSSSSVQPVGSAGGPGDDPGSVDPAAKPVRRSFTAEYRARVVAEYAAAPHGGEVRGVAAGGSVSVADPGMTDAREAIARGLPPRPNSHHRWPSCCFRGSFSGLPAWLWVVLETCEIPIDKVLSMPAAAGVVVMPR